MDLSVAQYGRLAPLLPVQRGNITLSGHQTLNALLYVGWRSRAGSDVHCRALQAVAHGLCATQPPPERGVLVWVSAELIANGISLDSTIINLHPNEAEASERGPQTIDPLRSGWMTNLYQLACDDRGVLTIDLSPGQMGNALAGRELLRATAHIRAGSPADGPRLRGRCYPRPCRLARLASVIRAFIHLALIFDVLR